MPGLTLAIGDIHGCSVALDTVIDAIKPRTEVTIVILGDYIDRGSDSRGVFERLIDLGRRCRLVPILGNHDQMLLDVRSGKHPIYWLLDIGGTTTLDSYGPGRDLSLIPDDHFEFLESCLDFFETDSHIFVHANYFPDIPMDEQPVGVLRWESLHCYLRFSRCPERILRCIGQLLKGRVVRRQQHGITELPSVVKR